MMDVKLQLLTLLATVASVLASDEIIAELGKTTKISSNFTLSKGERVASVVWQHGPVTVARSVFGGDATYGRTGVLLDDDFSLRFANLKFGDAGDYALQIVTNLTAYGIQWTLKILASPVLEAEATPVVINELSQPEDVAECRAENGSSPYSIAWYDNDGKLVSNASDVTTAADPDNGELTDSRLVLQKIVDITDNDKQYTCVVVDVFNKRQEQTVSLKVTEPTTTVQTTTVQAHPVIVSFPTSQTMTFMLGETRELECEATGVPDPMVGWSKDGQKIGEKQVSRKSISVKASQYSAGGEYKCVATNQEGRASKALKVEVQGKPEISDTDTVVNGSEEYVVKPDDSHVALVCEAASIPIPEITWTADEKDINDFQVSMDSIPSRNGVTSYLNISSKHFTGENTLSTVTCVARNKHGKDEKSFSISVSPVRPSNIGLIVGIIAAILVLILVAALLYFFLVARKRTKSAPDEETGGLVGFATCCEGSNVKSKELREEDDDANGEHAKKVSEDGSDEEKQKLTETDETKPENGDKKVDEAAEDEEGGNKQEDGTEDKTKRKRKIPFPSLWCGSKKKNGKIPEEVGETQNGDAKSSGEDQEPGQGNTLEKIDEEDNEKK